MMSLELDLFLYVIAYNYRCIIYSIAIHPNRTNARSMNTCHLHAKSIPTVKHMD